MILFPNDTDLLLCGTGRSRRCQQRILLILAPSCGAGAIAQHFRRGTERFANRVRVVREELEKEIHGFPGSPAALFQVAQIRKLTGQAPEAGCMQVLEGVGAELSQPSMHVHGFPAHLQGFGSAVKLVEQAPQLLQSLAEADPGFDSRAREPALHAHAFSQCLQGFVRMSQRSEPAP